ncbi:MAG: GNAT family N-acetyltransferase [Nocardioidaceae bacterium]
MGEVSRRVVSVTLDNIDDLPLPCRQCTAWELGNHAPDPSGKAEWLSAVLLDWGSCGRLIYVDGAVAGFALYAPPEYAEGAGLTVTSTISADAVLLMSARILPEFASTGLGRVLVQTVVKDLLRRRGVRAIEAFGDAQGRQGSCVTPAEFLTAVGFKTVQPHPRYPRLRLDLRGVLTWRADVEVALDRWLGALRPAPLAPDKGAGPVGASPRTGPHYGPGGNGGTALSCR